MTVGPYKITNYNQIEISYSNAKRDFVFSKCVKQKTFALLLRAVLERGVCSG